MDTSSITQQWAQLIALHCGCEPGIAVLIALWSALVVLVLGSGALAALLKGLFFRGAQANGQLRFRPEKRLKRKA